MTQDARDSGMARTRGQFFGMVVGLMVQFLLGMAVNLWVKVPPNHPGANPPEYFGGVVQGVTWATLHGPLLLILHSAWGLLLVVNGAVIALRAWPQGSRTVRATAVVGATAILAAGFNGGSYLNYNEDVSSFLMAAFFAVAAVTYTAGLFATRDA